MEISTASQPVTYIYALADPRETDAIKRIRYIGKTKNPDRRFARHLRDAKTGIRRYCCNWIRELFALGLTPGLEVISSVDTPSACQMERETIARFRLLGVPLTNLTDGGEGVPGRKSSPETRAKLSAANTGKKHSPETRARLSAVGMGKKNALGHHPSEEARRRMSAGHTGRRHSEESIGKMRGNKNHLGHRHSEEVRAGISAILTGRKLSPEHCAKLSAVRKGKKRSPEHRASISATLMGHRHSEETKRKISESNRRTRELKKATPCS